MDGISRSRGWDKEIPHGVLPMEQLVLSDKWARKAGDVDGINRIHHWCSMETEKSQPEGTPFQLEIGLPHLHV